MMRKGGIQHALVIAAFELFDLFHESNPRLFKS